jgi:hypothetical protein
LKKRKLYFFFILIAQTSYSQIIDIKLDFVFIDSPKYKIDSLLLYKTNFGLESLEFRKINVSNRAPTIVSIESKATYNLKLINGCCRITEFIFNSDTLIHNQIYRIIIQPQAIELQELVVKTKKERFENSGDTLIINTKPDDARPHAASSTLFDRIPGLSNDFGALSVLGKRVQEVTINGRKIFGGNPTLSLDAIKADMIEKMEFIDKNLANGQSQNTLNIRLKPNKQNGGYGLLAGGVNLKDRFLINGNYNKITKRGFLNVFSTANNINQRGTDSKTLSSLQSLSIKRAMNVAGSVIGLYDTSPKIIDESSKILTQRIEGVNMLGDAGVSYNFSKKKIEFDIFAYGNFRNGEIIKQKTSEMFLSDMNQKITQNQISILKNQFFNSSLNLTWKPTVKSTIRFFHKLNFVGTGNTESDSINNVFANVKLNSFILSNSDRVTYESSQDLGLSIINIGKKKGVISSLLVGGSQEFFPENIMYSNFITSGFFQNNSDRFLQKDQKSINGNLQFNHARPISKKILLEGKIKYEYDSRKSNQIYLPSKESFKIDSNFQYSSVTNSLFESGLYALYQRPRFSVVSGLSFWHWDILRLSGNNHVLIKNNYLINPFTKIEYKLPNKTIWFRIASEPLLPSWSQLGVLPDSSKINSILFGNVFLESINERVLELNYKVTNKRGLQIGFNLACKKYSNPIISKNTFNPELNIFIGSYSNFGTPTSSINFNVNAFKIKLNSKFSSFFLGGVIRMNSFQSINNIISPLKTTFAFYNFSSTLKLNKKYLVKGNWSSQFSFLSNKLVWNNSFNISNDFELGRKWYLDSKIKLNVNKTQTNNYFYQTFLDFELNKYILKNNGLKAGIKVVNALDIKNQVQVNQNSNLISYQFDNILPRVFMINITIYPESWK